MSDTKTEYDTRYTQVQILQNHLVIMRMLHDVLVALRAPIINREALHECIYDTETVLRSRFNIGLQDEKVKK
jgi:hypothetical protein